MLFRDSEPVFVDLTSIVPIADRGPAIWPALDQFQSFFVRPLILAADGKGKLARALLVNNIDGPAVADVHGVLSLRARMGHPGLSFAHGLERLVQRRPGLRLRLKRLAGDRPVRADKRVRARFLGGLRARLLRFRFTGAGDLWSEYYASLGAAIDRRRKLTVVGDLLERLRPQRVTDLGCNTGVFSLLAAERGARVIAIDSDETCIERLYRTARDGRRSITALIADVLCPTPALGFMGREFPDLMARARGDLVLCLGLMHHLHVNGRQSFERIAAMLDELSTRQVVFEFVARDDPNVALLHSARAVDYDLAQVRAALGQRFSTIEALPSDRPTRTILLCGK